MTIFHKLYYPLRSWNCKFYNVIRYLTECSLTEPIANTRKVVALNTIIANHADIYNKILKEDLSNVEWQSIRDKMLQVRNITTAIVDVTIIDMCLKEFHMDKAAAYFKFLKENNYPLNAAIVGKYLRLYVLKRNSLTEADKSEIVTTYNILKEKYPYLDAITAEHCVTSLCLTDQWRKAQEIIDTMKITTIPGTSVYSALAGAAFRNVEPSLAWEALLKIVSRKLVPQSNVYESHLQFCERDGKQAFDERIEEMFAFWERNNLMPYSRIIKAYANVASKYGWTAATTTISKTGKCEHCSSSLSKLTFSKESFQELVESVMKKIIIGPDIYHKTNPQELQKFKKFIEQTKPYDIVIDGLNMTYFQRTQIPTFQTLIKVVEYFSQRDKKILVLTRKHQGKLPIWKYIPKHAFVYLIDNLSADDPYILYATMASGNNAMFISMDLMRQHKHSLQNIRLQQEFKKWQYSHQYFVKKKGQNIHIQEPFIYVPTAHKNAEHWHIPYVNDDSTYADTYEFPKRWYCFWHYEK